MRALLQRVTRASVTVEGEVIGAIGPGLLVLAAVKKGDTPGDCEWIAGKIAGVRVFPDGENRMNRSVTEAGGKVLLVSQFTLYGDVRKGRRPSFDASAGPGEAVPMLEHLQASIERAGIPVETGKFGAHMVVDLVNDGPVTLMLDSERRRGGKAEEALPSGRFRLVGADSPLHDLPLILASESPRRRDLLREIGLAFTIQAPGIDETIDLPEGPEKVATTLAERKAQATGERFRECLVLAADTVVTLDDRVYGKPADGDDACRILRALSGREHRVVTGVCVVHAARGIARTRVVSTGVRFRPVADEEIRRYVATGEPFGKAGAYAIQGLGGLLVAGIDGDYSNVVGLPLGATLDLLEEVIGKDLVAKRRA